MRRGQVLVVMLLILSVVVTIALSISSRTATDVQVTTTQDESARALEAAEIGLERYLGGAVNEHTSDTIYTINASYNLPVLTSMAVGSSFAVPYPLYDGDFATVDLPQDAANKSFNSVSVCWGINSGTTPHLAIEVEFFYKDNTGKIYVKRRGIEPNPVSYSGFAGVGAGTGSCGTATTYKYSWSIGTTLDGATSMNLGLGGVNTGLFMRVRMLGNGSNMQPVAVQLGNNKVLPDQGGTIESVGVAGSTTQKVRAKVSIYDLPAMFDSAIFSGTSLTKQGN